jgi:hypothetical protein
MGIMLLGYILGFVYVASVAECQPFIFWFTQNGVDTDFRISSSRASKLIEAVDGNIACT